MAKTRLPDALERRHWLEKALEPTEALRVAEAYLAEGRSIEALAFLGKAGARERLATLRDQAVRAGDVFLLREVAIQLAEEPDAATWRSLADAAEAAGRERYALEARRLAAREA